MKKYQWLDRNAPSVWKLAGMTQSDYARLPWPEKRALIKKYFDLPVADPRSLEERLEEEKKRLPPELRDHPQGFLIMAYREHMVDCDRIKENTGVEMDCRKQHK